MTWRDGAAPWILRIRRLGESIRDVGYSIQKIGIVIVETTVDVENMIAASVARKGQHS